jgi:flagellar motility protein MotE (MotC chaperone)
MKKIIQLLLVALTMFGSAAGASLTWQKMHATDDESAEASKHTDGDSSEESDESPKTTHRPPARVASTEEPPVNVPVQPTYTPGVEETVRLASSLRERAALVREREDQLSARNRQLELVIENIRTERAAIDELREELEAALKSGEDHLADVQRQRTELDIKQQNIDGKVTEMAGHEKDNIKKMASMYDNMAAESAAKIIQHMADGGTMDTAVKLLAAMRERQAAKVLAEMPDPSLAAQLSERLKDFKHPTKATKERASAP